MENEEDIFNKVRDAFESVVKDGRLADYPKEALKLGTFVRANRFDKLGIITDAFYGDQDKDGKKIVIYTVLLLPKNDFISKQKNQSEQYYLSNEYEYEVTAYLMISPVDMKKLSGILKGGMYF